MAYRRVLCLAFSRRDGGNCFAGIDLMTGKWIRPVISPTSGALSDPQCIATTPSGEYRVPALLDIVDVDFLGPSPKIGQPENWIMGREPWRIVARSSVMDASRFLADDPELFRGYGRFVEAAEVQARPPQSSLALVCPQHLVWLVRPNPRSNHKQIIGTFSITGQSYSLPLTDPVYEKHFRDVPLNERRFHDPQIPVMLTLSLGDVMETTMRHYKLIAGVIH
jgi:hypothetical protein